MTPTVARPFIGYAVDHPGGNDDGITRMTNRPLLAQEEPLICVTLYSSCLY